MLFDETGVLVRKLLQFNCIIVSSPEENLVQVSYAPSKEMGLGVIAIGQPSDLGAILSRAVSVATVAQANYERGGK